jgi:hypothetical protein
VIAQEQGSHLIHHLLWKGQGDWAGKNKRRKRQRRLMLQTFLLDLCLAFSDPSLEGLRFGTSIRKTLLEGGLSGLELLLGESRDSGASDVMSPVRPCE